MHSRQVFVCAVVAALVGAAAAGAGTNPSPALSSLVLTSSDVPGSTVAFDGQLNLGGTKAYLTMFVPRRANPGPVVESLAILQPSAGAAADEISSLSGAAETAAGRRRLGAVLAKEASAFASSSSIQKRFGLKGRITVSKIVVGAASRPADGVLVLPMTMTLNRTVMRIGFAYIQVDRALDALYVIGDRKTAPAASLAPTISTLRAHLVSVFTVANDSPPTIAGTAAAGQPLTADYGAWTGGAAQFAYAWQRCDASGDACAPIAGATSATYVPTPADAGSTLRVAVTGSNTVSSQTGTSAPTSAVA